MSEVTIGIVDGLEEAPADGGTYARQNQQWIDLQQAANLQFNRGTSAEVAAYTPLAGEPVWDESTKNLFVGDGSTAGGILVGRRVVVSPTVDSQPITSATYSTPIAVTLPGNGTVWRVFGTLHFDGIDVTDADVQVDLNPNIGVIKRGSAWISAPAGSSYKTYTAGSVTTAVAQTEKAAVDIDYVVIVNASSVAFGLPIRRTAGTTAAYYNGEFSFLWAERLL
jgi:hypothetical protein